VRRALQPKEIVARRWEILQVSLLLTLLAVFFWKAVFLSRKLLPVDIAYTDPVCFCHAPAESTKLHNILLYDQAYHFYPWRVYTSQVLKQSLACVQS